MENKEGKVHSLIKAVVGHLAISMALTDQLCSMSSGFYQMVDCEPQNEINSMKQGIIGS